MGPNDLSRVDGNDCLRVLSLRSMSDLEIRIFQGGWRWLLDGSAEAELWAGTKRLGALPGHYVVMLIANELNRLALLTYMQERVGDTPLRVSEEDPAPPPPTTSPSILEARRARRRRRT